MKRPVYILSLVIILMLCNSLYSATLKKVLILNFNNIEMMPEFEFLDATITEAVEKMLKERYMFKSTPREKWELIANENYLIKRDYYTYSVSMNIGLLTRQDIVISGDYKIRDRDGYQAVITRVQIIDIGKRQIITEFSEEGPADNRIFNTVEKIADRIADEAKSILQNKEEWQRLGLVEEEERKPIIVNFSLSTLVGGGFYSFGDADRIEAEQPVLMINGNGNIPAIWERLAIQLSLTYLKHSPIKEKNPIIKDYTLTFNNYLPGLFFLVDFFPVKNLSIHPKLGAGYVFQIIEIKESGKENYTNSFPYFSTGVEILYSFRQYLSAIIILQNFLEIEKKTPTLLNTLMFGVNFKL